MLNLKAVDRLEDNRLKTVESCIPIDGLGRFNQ